VKETNETEQEQPPIKWYPYGHDFGNAEMSGAILNKSGTPNARNIPTAFTKTNKAAMKGLGVEVNRKNAFVFQFEGEEVAYAIGELALSQSRDPWNGRGDIERYSSKHALRGMLTIASTLIKDESFGLYVVGGLPAETYIKNTGLRRKIKSELDGTYKFTVDAGRTWRTAQVKVVNIVMEGAGALIAYGDKDAASRAHESAVIDIGGRTTDLYVARGQVPVTEYCKGKPVGVETATLAFMEAFENRHNLPLSLLQAREVMRTYAANHAPKDPTDTTKRKRVPYPEVSVYGQIVEQSEIEQLVKEAINTTATEIVSFVASTWRQGDTGTVAGTFKPVLLIGGGFYYFFDAVKRRIKHLGHPDEPQNANVAGYVTLATRMYAKEQEQAKAKAEQGA
jgi:plasmid segregation protein ParM